MGLAKVDLRKKIDMFVAGLDPLQLVLLDDAIKTLVMDERFSATVVPIVHTRSAAQNTFKPEDNLDYYYGR